MGCVIPPSTALAEGELVSDRPAAWGSRKALPDCPSRAIPAPLAWTAAEVCAFEEHLAAQGSARRGEGLRAEWLAFPFPPLLSA